MGESGCSPPGGQRYRPRILVEAHLPGRRLGGDASVGPVSAASWARRL